MRTLGRSLHKILKPLAQKKGFSDARVFSHWQQIVGKDMAAAAKPQKLNDNTLTLSVPNGAVAMDVQHQALQLMERINSHFGFRAVQRIKTVQTFMELEPVVYKQNQNPDKGAQIRAAAQVENVQDLNLRQALSRLGAYVEMRNSRAQNKKTTTQQTETL
mgnify:CR=1 FL=1